MDILVEMIVALLLLYFYGVTFTASNIGINLLTFLIWLILIFLLRLIGNIIYLPSKINREQRDKIENLESIINKPISIIASRGQDEIVGEYIFKQIQLMNQSPENLLSCYATIEGFYEITGDGKRNIEPKSYHLSWATTGRRTSNNDVDLIEGIPERLYIARLHPMSKSCSLVGEGGNNTSFEKVGTYTLQIRLLGKNFSSHTFNIRFIWNGRSDIEILEITNPSLKAP